MQKSREIAYCGISAALASVLVLLGGLLPGATYCAPILGMLPLLPVLHEFGSRPALAVYGVTAALVALLAPDREMSGVYLFFGYYPVLRPLLNRLCRPLRILCKLALFNLSLLALYTLLIWLFGLDALAETGGPALICTLLILGNAVFFLLDLALERLSGLWQYHLRKRFFRR